MFFELSFFEVYIIDILKKKNKKQAKYLKTIKKKIFRLFE